MNYELLENTMFTLRAIFACSESIKIEVITSQEEIDDFSKMCGDMICDNVLVDLKDINYAKGDIHIHNIKNLAGEINLKLVTKN